MNINEALIGYTIKDSDFKRFQTLIYQEAGIFLSEEKRALLVSRLSKRLKNLKIANFSDYYEYITSSSERTQEIIRMINRITTNKTDFFREIHHFSFLKEEIFPIYKEEHRRNIRIWSAGCSTGEEPYSIAMEVADFFGETPQTSIKILATDLDTDVLETAAAGEYSKEKIAPVEKKRLDRYCIKKPNGTYGMRVNIKNFITFRRLNLMQSRFPFRYGFDIIFCRNVLIYFTKEDRSSLIKKFHTVLRPGGFLMLGHSESLLNQEPGFKHIISTVYQRIG